MRQLQFLVKKLIHENENIKIKMLKKCLDCGAELSSPAEIIYHDCDLEIKDS
jgi:hypothetical protein